MFLWEQIKMYGEGEELLNSRLYSAGQIFENLVKVSNDSTCILALPNTATVSILEYLS